MIKTFTVLGGGSAYTPGLVAALLHHRARLDLTELRLHDLDLDHLDVVARLAQGMSDAVGGALRVRACPRLDEAIAGADAILNSTRPGGLTARLVDETVPVALGVPGQETVGPGGYFFARRSVPEALRVADVVAGEAPQAWLLNYTNPTNLVTQALTARGGVRVVGLCDQSDGDLEVLRDALGLTGRPRFLSAGTNHATWYSGLSFGGQAVTRIPETLAEVHHHDEEHALRFACSHALALALGPEGEGAWPNSYLPYYTHPELFVALSHRSTPRAQVILDKLPSYYRHFAEEAQRTPPVLRHHRGTAGFGDMAVEVLAALGRPSGQRLVLNVPSHGAQPGFDDDTVVELCVEVTPTGLVRVPGPPVPAPFAALHQRIERYQRAAAEAVVRGERAAEVEALALNPLVGTADLAAQLLADADAALAAR